MVFHIILPGVDGFVGGVRRERDTRMELLSRRVAPDLADDHGDRVGAELDPQGQVKVVHRFHEADAADLKKVVRVFAAGGKSA